MQWSEVLAEARLRDLPYKMELNEYGQIVMVPHRPAHSRTRTRIAKWLDRLLPEGESVQELAIHTSRGTKVADVIWCSPQRAAAIFAEDPVEAPLAPEICIEVVSRGNTGSEMEVKRRLYFEAGATEVWLCGPEGEMRFFAPEGELERSRLAPEFPWRVEGGAGG